MYKFLLLYIVLYAIKYERMPYPPSMCSELNVYVCVVCLGKYIIRKYYPLQQWNPVNVQTVCSKIRHIHAYVQYFGHSSVVAGNVEDRIFINFLPDHTACVFYVDINETGCAYVLGAIEFCL